MKSDTIQNLYKICGAAALASIVSLSIHISLKNRITPLASKAMQNIQISSPPYNSTITSLAYLTNLIPALTIAYIYHRVGNLIPCKNRLSKGLILGGLICLIKGALVRQPLMDFIIGIPIKIVILNQSQIWLSNFSLGIIIALLIKPSDIKKE